MVIVVKQVAILRHEALGRRLSVVRSEHSADIWLGGEDRGETGEHVPVNTDIRVDKHDHVAASDLEAAVSRIGRPVRLAGKSYDGIGVSSGNHIRVIGASIVDNDELPLFPGKRAGFEGSEGQWKYAPPLMRGYYDRDARPARRHGA